MQFAYSIPISILIFRTKISPNLPYHMKNLLVKMDSTAKERNKKKCIHSNESQLFQRAVCKNRFFCSINNNQFCITILILIQKLFLIKSSKNFLSDSIFFSDSRSL